jgi:hypothetical protein
MTKPKPKPLGSTIEVVERARVIRPGGTEADALTVSGGVYVFDVPGTHTIDGTSYEVSHEPEVAAQP